jgi:hypothetical protein
MTDVTTVVEAWFAGQLVTVVGHLVMVMTWVVRTVEVTNWRKLDVLSADEYEHEVLTGAQMGWFLKRIVESMTEPFLLATNSCFMCV